MLDNSTNQSYTASQRYLSTRGGDYSLSFEEVVLKGLAADGGLFLPGEIPSLPDWQAWKNLSYTELAFQILSLYISNDEIPANDLKTLINRSYATFRTGDIAPLVHLEGDLYLLELFHGPSYSFKDCALQFLGNLFEYFLGRKNEGKEGRDRYRLTVVGATSGDTGSAAIYGLRGKKDVSVFILYPNGRISPIQEAQMTSVSDNNVHNLALNGTFDDCQDIVKMLFNDPDTNRDLKLGAVNSINWSRILAQIVYYWWSYFQLIKVSSSFQMGDKVRIVTPTGNFGNILAGYFAKKMGLPVDKLVVATNENDILDRFWKTGRYEKQPVHGREAEGGLDADGVKAHEQGCRETLSPAMDILVSSNFERLMWLLAKDHASTHGSSNEQSMKQAGHEVSAWYQSLRATGGFGPVPHDLLEAGRISFESERVDDKQTLQTIKSWYEQTKYVLDPHSAVGIAAAERSINRSANLQVPHISLSTAHPAKFSAAVKQALKQETAFNFEEQVLPPDFIALLTTEKRVTMVENSWEVIRDIIKSRVQHDLKVEKHALI